LSAPSDPAQRTDHKQYQEGVARKSSGARIGSGERSCVTTVRWRAFSFTLSFALTLTFPFARGCLL
jgi:hypothetical protein